MRAIVVVENSPKKHYLVELPSGAIAERVKRLLANHKRSEAIVTALSEGDYNGEVEEKDIPNTAADVILTKNGTYWDLM